MDNNLKVINILRYDGESVNLNNQCMSHTVFQKNEVLEVLIYNNMIVIAPALPQDNTCNN